MRFDFVFTGFLVLFFFAHFFPRHACVMACTVLCWPHPFYEFFVLTFGFKMEPYDSICDAVLLKPSLQIKKHSLISLITLEMRPMFKAFWWYKCERNISFKCPANKVAIKLMTFKAHYLFVRKMQKDCQNIFVTLFQKLGNCLIRFYDESWVWVRERERDRKRWVFVPVLRFKLNLANKCSLWQFH